MGEGDLKPKPKWAEERDKKWKAKSSFPDQLADQQNKAFRARRANIPGLPTMSEIAVTTPGAQSDGPEQPDQSVAPTTVSANQASTERSRDISGAYERRRALDALEAEKEKVHDRIRAAHLERSHRMRSSETRRKEKTIESKKSDWFPHAERMERINALLRAGVYDQNRLRKILDSPGETIKIELTTGDAPVEKGKARRYSAQAYKEDLVRWYDSLNESEKKRLYTIGRKKIDFVFRPGDYPKLLPQVGDSPRTKAFKERALAREEKFQSDQKKLADALEVAAVPMIQDVFESLGQNVHVYLSSPNDDIAGGIDVVTEFLKPDGTPILFHDGAPMRLAIDVTYARMRGKLEKDVARGRVCDEAYQILKDDDEEVPIELSNARAMKLFRTVVETLGGTMSMQTFGKDAPLPEPQRHVPRLIVGVDWGNAFSSIANWVEQGDEFKERFGSTRLAKSIALSIKNQLTGLHVLAAQHPDNPNTPYLTELLQKMNFDSIDWLPKVAQDESLRNIDQLLTLETLPLRSWQRDRLYRAALAQIAHDAARGSRSRGDAIDTNSAPSIARHEPVQPKTEVATPPLENSGDTEAERLRRRIVMLDVLALRRRIAEAERSK